MAEVLEVACLHTIAEYIQGRRNTVLKFRKEKAWHQGTSSCQVRWEQLMELKETSAEAEAAAKANEGG